jgi:Tol biopolymer transport system component
MYFEGVSMQVRNLWRVRVDPSSLAWEGVPERLTLGEGADSGISVSSDGKRLAFGASRERTRLWSVPLTASPGATGEALTSGGAGEFDAAVSADGRTLVYRTIRFGRQELWARTLADNTQRLLIAGTDWVRSSPRLSNDGRRVAYRLTPTPGNSAQGAGVAVLEPNGAEIIVSAPSGLFFVPDDWSKDDSKILGGCIAPSTRRFSVCTLSAQTNSQPEVLASAEDREFFSPHYSPNQRWIRVVERAAPRGRDWTAAITVIPARGGPHIRITDGQWNDEKPRWSADGRAIYFVSNRAGFLNVWGRRFDPDAGKPEGDVFQVTRFESPDRRIPTDLGLVEISVSGNRIFLPVTELTATIWTLEGADH